jgi:hypothetical protein
VSLHPPVDLGRDHVLGPPDAEMTLVEYGSYACGTAILYPRRREEADRGAADEPAAVRSPV